MGTLPCIIQGGMGIGVSSWKLARAVSSAGELGVVSGTAIDSIFVRRLQDGDLDGSTRRACKAFPIPAIAQDALQKFFIEGGRAAGIPYKLLPLYRESQEKSDIAHQGITMLAAFCEIYLAKEGHENPVGMNLLTKIQLGNLPAIYGAMLAGLDYLLMGAGIPREIPHALDQFARGEAAQLRLDCAAEANTEVEQCTFDPRNFFVGEVPLLKRPKFLPIVSSHTLACSLAKRPTGSIEGFVVEGFCAGGHNSPPREKNQVTASGEPLYGERDIPDLVRIRELGLPFWLAGGQASPTALAQAQAQGAQGIQVGTLFSLCNESGFSPEIRKALLAKARENQIHVRTDPRASPTGFPFKMVQLAGSLSEEAVYETRERICDLGYLRSAYRKADGHVGYRCPAEPPKDFVHKGGTEEDSSARRCLCNSLLAAVGLGQERDGVEEAPLLTAGEQLQSLGPVLAMMPPQFAAKDVLGFLRGNA